MKTQQSRCRGVLAVMAVIVALSGCARPARVVLYEDRHVGEPKGATVQPARPVRPVPPRTVASVHEIRSGDTVYSVANRYRVSLRGLIELNRLQAPFVLRAGKTLRLPAPRLHVVRSGDTIYGISRTYDVALSRLVRVNGIEPPYTIAVGRELRLPGSLERAPPVRRAAAPVRQAKPPAKKVTPRRRAKQIARTPKIRKRPAAAPKPPPMSGAKFLLPVRGRILSKFGPVGRGLRNDGVNIAAPRGTPVRAAENGIVVYSGNALLGFGNMVLLRHANGFMTAYGHNDTVAVSRGATVRRGQVIATVGSTGNVASPQLHFEIRKGRRAVNPAKFLPNLKPSA